jgi:polysaccharide export outer membrane protein
MPRPASKSLLPFLVAALAACSQVPLEPQPPPPPAAYRLAPGDRVRITTFGEERFSGEFTVDQQGRIQFPLLGDVPAAGLRADEFRTALTQALAGKVLRNPSVAVDLTGVRPVYILGEVNRPGEFPYAEGLSVYALVAKAGGFTLGANQQRVAIRHLGADSERAYRLTPTTPVSPGDTVRIEERLF